MGFSLSNDHAHFQFAQFTLINLSSSHFAYSIKLYQMELNISEWRKMELPDLQTLLKNIYTSMLQYEKQCDYVNAELYRSAYEKCTQYLRDRTLQHMQFSHKKETHELETSRNNQLTNFHNNWDQKLDDYDQQCKRLMAEMKNRNEKEQMAKRMEMEDQLSTKVKESNQLLNLRKMEEHAAKQKNYVEAHSIQQKANKVYSQELQDWMQARENKIQITLKNMRARQDAEMEGTNRKIKLTLEDYAKERFLGDQGINQMFDNLLKEMKAQHERNILSLYGELRNLGGQSPSKKIRTSPEIQTKSQAKAGKAQK